MLLHDLILTSCDKFPTRPAVVRRDEELSYAQLSEQVKRTANALSGIGIRPGDRVAVYLNKRFEAVLAYFGSSCAGAVFVPINSSLKPPQIAHILDDCDVSALVTSTAQARELLSTLRDRPKLRHLLLVDESDIDAEQRGHLDVHSWHSLIESASAKAPSTHRIDMDIASILYTSGSTGKPKGVVLSHRNMVAGAISVASYLGNSENDRLLAVLPFSFDAGFSQMTTAFYVGAAVVLLDYLLPNDVIRAIARHRATGLAGVPPLWTQLAQLDWPDTAVASLRYITNTGGAMPTATLRILRERLPTTLVFLMYGLTEAFRSTYLPPAELDRRPTSMGKAIPNAEIMVVRPDGTRCDDGEPGELVHRGALVALGYWNDPQRTALRFRPAPGQPSALPFKEIAVWSGDTVVRDDDGFLYFVGRMDDMIKSSGYRISPTEVEEIIYSTNLVRDCAALGIPHTRLGQAVVVVCHTDNAIESVRNSLLDACKVNLPNYMVPTEFVFQDALPRNPNGKIDRKYLSQHYADLFKGAD